MTWLRPVDRTSGTLTLNAGTLSCLAHHGTPLSERCPTTTALERTIVPMDDAERMPPLGAVKPRQKFFDVIHRAQSSTFKKRTVPHSVLLRVPRPRSSWSGQPGDREGARASRCPTSCWRLLTR
jgi:hypothetical protein